jgi:outer membrane protein
MKSLLLALVLTFSFGATAANSIKIGTVHIQKVMTSIKEGKGIMKKLKASFDKRQKELKGAEDKIRKMQEDYKKQSLVLSDKAKVKKEQELQKMVIGLQQKTVQYQKEIQKQEAQLKKPILEKLKNIIDSVSKKEGVAMTLEVSQSPVVYAQESVDLTPLVIDAYDKKFK